MKNLTYVAILFTLLVFNCSPQELEENFTSEDFRSAENSSMKIPQASDVCNRVTLYTVDNVEVGVVDFTVLKDKFIISYKTYAKWQIMNTNLSVKDISGNFFPVDGTGVPIVNDFENKGYHPTGVNEVTYTLKNDGITSSTAYAANAIVINSSSKNGVNAWGAGVPFKGPSKATYTEVGKSKCAFQ